jgi:osmotically-inducible protein OsmY
MMRRWCVWLLLVLMLHALVGCAPLDRRSLSTSFEDEHIESQAISLINTRHTGIVHVNVTSFNRHVLLTGEVPDEASKSEIAQIVAAVPNINGISNEVVVGDIEGIASRSADSLITSDVKLRFIGNGRFGPGRVKVVTENGTVFLLGLVYHNEAESAAYLASTTKGVKRVITMFEYLD